MHNLRYYQRLMLNLRIAIEYGNFNQFVTNFTIVIDEDKL